MTPQLSITQVARLLAVHPRTVSPPVAEAIIRANCGHMAARRAA